MIHAMGFFLAFCIVMNAALFWVTLGEQRRLRGKEKALLAEKQAWESQKHAEVVAIRAEPDEAQYALIGTGETTYWRNLELWKN